MSMKLKLLSTVVGLAAMGISAGIANAAVLTLAGGAGQTFAVNWSLDPDGAGPLETLSATANFSVFSYSASSLVLDISITNTTNVSPPGGFTTANILSFGFYVTPEIQAALTTPGTKFDGLTNDTNFPGGFNGVDVCLWAGNNCSGGPIGDGLTAGSADALRITLTPAVGGAANDLDPSVTLSTFAIKYQTSGTSYEFAGCEGSCNPVPEPMTLGLLGAGLLGLGYAARRRRQS